MIDPTIVFANPSSAWSRRRGLVLVALALGVYAILLALHAGAFASGADSSGYMSHARLLAAGHLHATPRILPGLTTDDQRSMLFVPLGFVSAPDGNGMVPTYPSGLPLLIAATAQVVGWEHAGDVVICLHSLLGLLLIFSLGREMGLSSRGAVLGATIIGASPLYLNYSLQMMSDLPALVWTLGAVLAAWRSRGRVAWALAAGAAAAVAVLIRPTNVLVFAPIAVALGLSVRRWLLLIAGGLPGGIFFCLHSLSLYGRLFTTGYGAFGASFGRQWIGVTTWHYACWLPVLFTPVVLLALGMPWLARTEPRKTAMLGVWFLVFAAFYSTYDCTHQTWWYLRFLLPAVPPLVIGSLLVARQTGVGRRWPLFRTRVFVFALIAIIANSALWNKRLPSLNIGHDNKTYPEAAAWLQANLPGNAVVLSMEMSGTLYYYTNLTFLRWEYCHASERLRMLAALRNSHRPLYAALFPFELEGALHEHFPGPWTRIALVSHNMELWRYESDDAPVLPVAAPAPVNNPWAFAWRLPIDQSPVIRSGWLVANVIAWIMLAGLLWRLIPGNGWRDWLARAAILLSAGAIGSVRFALTDLVALALLAGAMLAVERRRHGWAAVLLGAAGLGRGAALFALPAVGSTPWHSPPNLRRWLLVVAFVALSTAAVCWHLDSAKPVLAHLAWPFGSLLEHWVESFTAVLHGQGLGLAWIGTLALVGLTAQAVFFFRHWHDKEPWWRLGMAYVVLMCFLDDAMWMGAAGGATRLLLPLTLAFNILARRIHASLAWLLAGNLAIVAGFFSLFLPPEAPSDMAAIRTAGFAQLTSPDNGWYQVETSARHTWAWSRGSARLDVDAWPRGANRLVISVSLRSLSPRTVVIRQGGQVMWTGTVDREYNRVTFPCSLTDGHALLDLQTDIPGVVEGSAPDKRTLAFAILDPLLSESNH